MMNLLFSITAALAIVQQGAPRDVPTNHWAYSAVDALYKAGILVGYPSGNYNGSRPVSRYEMATTVSKLSKASGIQEMQDKLAVAQEKSKDLATKQDLDDARQRVDSLREQVQSLNGDVSGVRSAMDQLRAQLAAMRQEMQEMRSGMKNKG